MRISFTLAIRYLALIMERQAAIRIINSGARAGKVFSEFSLGIKIKKIGNVSVCSLNLRSQLGLSYLSVIESRRALEWIKKNPQSEKIIEKIEQIKDNVHSVLIKLIRKNYFSAVAFFSHVFVNNNRVKRNPLFLFCPFNSKFDFFIVVFCICN